MSFRPAEVFHPGSYLKDALDDSGWTQNDFAEITGLTSSTVNDIVSERRNITPETAEVIGAALGTSAEVWVNLSTKYQLHKLSEAGDRSAEVELRSRIYAMAPVGEMVRRSWITKTNNVKVLESEILAFYGIESLDDKSDLDLIAARRSNTYLEGLSVQQRAWIARTKQLARNTWRHSYSRQRLLNALGSIHAALESAEEVRKIPRILADAGVAMVVVEGMKGGKIDGAAFFDERGPVVSLSLRFDRIDNFAFVLMHEIGHILNNDVSVDEDIRPGDDISEIEAKANLFAQEFLVPQEKLQNFIDRNGPSYSFRKIAGFASLNGVHPAVVVGQLQHKNEIGFQAFRQAFESVRSNITASAITDGFGHVTR